MSHFLRGYPITKLQGKTLLIPVVSSANVSQLAMDLFIATFSLERIGVFDPRDVVPVVGAREDGQEGVTVPLELYGREDLNFVLIQQRSPALKSRKQRFIDSVLQFIQESKFSAVMFLSGMDSIDRTDSQMLTPSFHVLPKNSPPLTRPLSKIQQLPIPEYNSPRTLVSKKDDSGDRIPFIPGGGLTRRFLDAIPDSWQISTAAILQFVMEGDNRADAHLLASVVATILDLKVDRGWKQPSSWEVGLFGTGHDQTLYG